MLTQFGTSDLWLNSYDPQRHFLSDVVDFLDMLLCVLNLFICWFNDKQVLVQVHDVQVVLLYSCSWKCQSYLIVAGYLVLVALDCGQSPTLDGSVMSNQAENQPERSPESTTSQTPAGESMDINFNDDSPASDSNARTANSLRRREKESLILKELSLTLHTIQNLSHVLEDIVHLTTSEEDTADNPSKDSVAVKQQLLLQELHEWKHLLESQNEDNKSSERGGDDGDWTT